MSRVFSMDSEGIWNACTMKVMTNTAMTMVVANDCSQLMPPECALADVCFTTDGSVWGATVTCGSVLTSLMTTLVRWRDLGRLPQNLLSVIVDSPKPFVQPPARLASWCCLRCDGRILCPLRRTQTRALPR